MTDLLGEHYGSEFRALNPFRLPSPSLVPPKLTKCPKSAKTLSHVLTRKGIKGGRDGLILPILLTSSTLLLLFSYFPPTTTIPTMVAAALALALLAVVSAAPTPRAPTANYYKPTASNSLCLTGFDGGKASV